MATTTQEPTKIIHFEDLTSAHRAELTALKNENTPASRMQFWRRLNDWGYGGEHAQHIWDELGEKSSQTGTGRQELAEHKASGTKKHGLGIGEKVKHFGGSSHHEESEDELEEEEEEERQERINSINLSKFENTPSIQSLQEIEKAKREGRIPPPIKTIKDDPRYREELKTLTARIQAKRYSNQFLTAEQQQLLIQQAKEELAYDFLQNHYDDTLASQYQFKHFQSKEQILWEQQRKRIEGYTEKKQEEQKKQEAQKQKEQEDDKRKQQQLKIQKKAEKKARGNVFKRIRSRFQNQQRPTSTEVQETTPSERLTIFRRSFSHIRSRFQNFVRNTSSNIQRGFRNGFNFFRNRISPQVNSVAQRSIKSGLENISKGLQGMLKNVLPGGGGGPASLLKGLPKIPGLPGLSGGLGGEAAELGEQVVLQGARSAVGAFLAGGGWIILLIIILVLLIIVIIILIIAGHNAQTNNNANQPITGLTITLKGPTQINNGTQLAYEVDVSCDQTCQQTGPIMIYEQTLPQGTSFASADGTYTTNPYPITWHLSQNTPMVTNGIDTYVFHFTLNTLQPNNDISNIIYGDLENGATNYQPVPGLTLNKTATTHVNIGQNITYTITANYTGTDTVTLSDQIPDNTKFISATGKYTNTNNTISWVLKDNGAGPNYSFNLTVQPTVNDVYITNTVYGTVPGAGNGTGSNIAWLDSYSHAQFDPHFDAWVWAQCSQASMAEIFNSYKKSTDPQYKIVDLETWAYMNGAPNRIWDPYGGLQYQQGISIEAAHYGFATDYKTYPINDTSLNTIIATAQQGHPVMMSAPGHWFVLWGADPGGNMLWLMDSSIHDLTWAPNHQVLKVPRSFFLHGGTITDGQGQQYSISPSYWTGTAVILTPQ